MPWWAGLWQRGAEANAVQTLEISFPLLCSVRTYCGIFRAGTERPHPTFTVWMRREAEIRAELIKSHYTKQGECFPLRAERERDRDRSSSKLGCSQPLHSAASDCVLHEQMNESSPHREVSDTPHDCYCCGRVGGIHS